MIHLTLLLFLHPGKEALFQEYEEKTLALLPRYGGELLCRLRPRDDAFLEGSQLRPDEVHVLSFPSEQDFAAYLADEDRKQLTPLREASISSSILIQGTLLNP